MLAILVRENQWMDEIRYSVSIAPSIYVIHKRTVS